MRRSLIVSLSVSTLILLAAITVTARESRGQQDASSPTGNFDIAYLPVSDSADAPPGSSDATPDGGGGQVAKKNSQANERPLSVGGKFKLFANRSFVSPEAYGLSIASGAFGEWIDNDHGHHSNPGDFAADSATRAARSFTFRTTANFFEKFAYPSMFKQDPRYHRSDKKGAIARVGYAVSRLFVTQGDNGGNQFNTSFIAGGLTTAAISNAWERDERRNASDTMKRWGLHVGFTAASNILREFIGRP